MPADRPTVDAIAGDFDGRAIIGKMDVDDNPRTPAQYQVRGIPTLLIFKAARWSIRSWVAGDAGTAYVTH